MKSACFHFPAIAALTAVCLLGASGVKLAAQSKETAAGATKAGESSLVRYVSQPTGNKCRMDGTAPLKEWSMESLMISGSWEVDANFPESALANPAAAKPVLRVRIPVRTFKSGHQTMDEAMQGHMQITKFPNIEYRLIELKPKSPPGTTGAIQFDAVGALTITGHTLTNTMPVTIEKKDGKLKVVGTAPVKMSDYGVERYSYLGVKVGDELKISYEWISAPAAK